MAGQHSGQLAVVTGRSGIKIPDLDTSQWQGNMWGYTPLNFFHALWTANGIDPSTHYGDNGYRNGPRPSSDELVLLPSGGKPLTVVRRRFEARDSKAIEHDVISTSARWAEYDRPSTPTGSEVHEVVVPPQELGPFAVRWQVSFTHSTSGGSFTPGSSLHQPKFTQGDPETSGGKDINKWDYWSEEGSDLTPLQRETAMSATYSNAIRSALGEMVEFLS